jgi:hypothetical protein
VNRFNPPLEISNVADAPRPHPRDSVRLRVLEQQLDRRTTQPGRRARGRGLTGTFGADAIKPVLSGLWIGTPDNAAESGGGPFVYLFSGPVTCADLSKGTGWISALPAGTQVLEMIIGTTSTGSAMHAAAHAAANVAEVNYATAPSSTESRATTGTVTLTSYAKGVAVEGTIDVTFPTGGAKGSFHADWCPTGHEF